MQEKDIRKKLNQELDDMAPDILNKILAHKIEPVKSEKELFGKNRPLFKEKTSMRQIFWAPVVTAAIAACILIAIIIIQPWTFTKTTTVNTAFDIIIDVNPSISIKVGSDGTVDRVVAGNKDAKKIVEKINRKIGKDASYNKAVKTTIKQLDKAGYLKKNKNAMLLSVVSDDREAVKNTVKDIKKTAKECKDNQNIKCSTVYQNFEVNEKIQKVADKNKVSVGKAAFCIKIAEKEKVDADNLCDKNIYTLIEEAKVYEAELFEQDMVMEGELEIIVETESVTGETESLINESESITYESESESVSIEETSTMAESQSVEVTSGEYQTEQEVSNTPQVTTN